LVSITSIDMLAKRNMIGKDCKTNIKTVNRIEGIFLIESSTGACISWELFYRKVQSWLEVFRRLKLTEQQKVAIIAENSSELLVFYFSALIARLVLIPVDPQKGISGINEIIEIAKPDRIFIEKPEYCTNRDPILFQPLTPSTDYDKALFEKRVEESKFFAGPYLVTFTSGTTGIPKGVVHSSRNLFLSAEALINAIPLQSNMRFYHVFPMTYMAGIINTFWIPFWASGSVLIGSRFSVSSAVQFWEDVSRYGANCFWLSPTMVSLLLKLDRGTIGIDYCKGKDIVGISATAALPYQQQIDFETKYRFPVFESYGLSETLFNCTNGYKVQRKVNCIGKPLEKVDIKIDDDGEVLVRAPWMFLGYLNEDADSYYQGSYYRTGDLGMIDRDGHVFITGRKKDLIIRGGMNISPRKIEEFIYREKHFEDFCVFGVEDEILGERTICFANQERSKAENNILLKKIISLFGSDYKIDEFVYSDSIPRNSAGKIDRNKARQLYLEKKNNL